LFNKKGNALYRKYLPAVPKMAKKRAREADGASEDPDKMVEDNSSDEDVSMSRSCKVDKLN
jgi:hypothetical protein